MGGRNSPQSLTKCLSDATKTMTSAQTTRHPALVTAGRATKNQMWKNGGPVLRPENGRGLCAKPMRGPDLRTAMRARFGAPHCELGTTFSTTAARGPRAPGGDKNTHPVEKRRPSTYKKRVQNTTAAVKKQPQRPKAKTIHTAGTAPLRKSATAMTKQTHTTAGLSTFAPDLYHLR